MEKERKPKHFIQQPEFPGGPKAMTQFIYSNLRLPQAVLEANIEGTVYSEITINHKGVVTEVKILQSLGHGCDEEAARVLKMLKFDVGKNRGVKVLFHKKIKVQFKKPVAQTQAPAQMQVQYVVTPAAPQTKPQETAAEPATKTYSYTISF